MWKNWASSQVALVVKNTPANAGDIRDKGRRLVKKIPWRRKWQPTPVFLSARFMDKRDPESYSPWGHKELDTTEHMALQANFLIDTEYLLN